MTAQEKLIEIYEKAEKRLRDIILKKGVYADASMYQRSLLRQVRNELSTLKQQSAAAVQGLVEDNYEDALQELIDELIAEGISPLMPSSVTPDGVPPSPEEKAVSAAELMMSGLNAGHIEVIARNATADFNRAIGLVGRRVSDFIREETLEATAEKLSTGQTVRQMQKNLEEKLKTKNITAVPYKNGAEMPLKKYAEMAARSTTAETQNTAKTAQGKEWGYDLVHMTSHAPTCPICAMYQDRVYATTPEAANGKYKLKDGTVLTFPYLYDTAFASGYMTIHPNCRHRISIFPIRAYTNEELIEYSQKSSAPFEDTRSDAERKAYAADQARKRKQNEQRKQYEKIKQALPDTAPKSYAGFVRMKQANSQRYQDLMEDYRYILKQSKISEKSVAKSADGGIIESKEVSKMSINSIDMPIEQRNTGKGNPNAILTFGIELNNRQKKLLEVLTEFDSRVTVPKKSVSMTDLSALTACTGDEFAMFTKGGERLIIRGDGRSVNIDIEDAKKMAEQGYRWSGHTHPGINLNCLVASDGDTIILRQFNQNTSVIYNSKGQYSTFDKE